LKKDEGGKRANCNFKRHIVEIGQVIDGHYVIQRVVKQGQISTVYQGFDRKLQRVVALKAVPAVHLPAYRAAARILSQFSHPNIIGLYDLFIEPEALYLVQEYVEGEDFAALLQAQLQPFDVIAFGRQICLALIYAGSSARGVCHGDLTPAAVMRDRRGFARINNFALPSDFTYFTAWSAVGGDGIAISDTHLAWGIESEERQSDDVRAVGLLLYQLLTVRPSGMLVVVPPQDGQLHFPRSVPRDVCEVIARAIIRQHPQHIKTADALHDELQVLEELLEPLAPITLPDSGNSGNSAYTRPPVPIQFSPAAPNSYPAANINAIPAGQSGPGPATYAPEVGTRAAYAAPQSNIAQTISDSSLRVAAPTPNRMIYPEVEPLPRLPARHSPLLWLLIIGLLVFALFFVVGYYAGVFFVH
jgi:serine/threonine protein kinase